MHQIGLPFHWAFAGEVVGDNANDLTSLVADPNVSMHEVKVFACQVTPGGAGRACEADQAPARRWPTREPVPDTPAAAQPEGGSAMTSRDMALADLFRQRPVTPPADARSSDSSSRSGAELRRSRARPRASTPIRPSASAARRARSRASSGTSFPRTGSSGPATATTTPGTCRRRPGGTSSSSSSSREGVPCARPGSEAFDPGRWLMMSDVCKHCVDGARASRPAPPASLIYNEFGNVYIQPDICNGCGYCIAACPFGVITRSDHRRPRPQVHPVLRPADGRPGARLRQGLPDRVDPVRPDRRAAGAGPEACGGLAPARRLRCVPVWRRADRATPS